MTTSNGEPASFAAFSAANSSVSASSAGFQRSMTCCAMEGDHGDHVLRAVGRQRHRLVAGHVVPAGREHARPARDGELVVAGRQLALELQLDLPVRLELRARQSELVPQAAERLAAGRAHEAVVVHRRQRRPRAGVLERRHLEQLAHGRPGAEVEAVPEQRAGERQLLGEQAGERLGREALPREAEVPAARCPGHAGVHGQHVGCVDPCAWVVRHAAPLPPGRPSPDRRRGSRRRPGRRASASPAAARRAGRRRTSRRGCRGCAAPFAAPR
jgi:hypothetical protein